MTAVVWHTVTSLDGFIAGPGDAMDWVFELDLGEAIELRAVADRLGALVVGRRTMDVEDRDQHGFYGGSFQGPFFVVSRHRREPPVVKGVTGTVVEGPIEDVVGRAAEAAGAADVGLLGADVARQALRAGLVDEVVLHVAPVLLGGGVPLWAGEPGEPPVRLRRTGSAVEGDLVVLRHEVLGRPGSSA